MTHTVLEYIRQAVSRQAFFAQLLQALVWLRTRKYIVPELVQKPHLSTEKFSQKAAKTHHIHKPNNLVSNFSKTSQTKQNPLHKRSYRTRDGAQKPHDTVTSASGARKKSLTAQLRRSTSANEGLRRGTGDVRSGTDAANTTSEETTQEARWKRTRRMRSWAIL